MYFDYTHKLSRASECNVSTAGVTNVAPAGKKMPAGLFRRLLQVVASEN